MKNVEKELEIQSSEITFENMTKSNLKAAAEMYVFLNTCPPTDELKFWFKSWLKFFTDIFESTPKEIMLTLNRLLSYENSQNKEVQIIVKKLFERITSLFSIKYEEYQNVLPGYTKKGAFKLSKSNMQGIITL